MQEPAKAAFEYSGVENLEAMKEARNYNRFLLDLLGRNLTGLTVVDFGAGAGTFALPLSKTDVVVVCIEPDPGLRDDLSSSGLTAHADLEAIPLSSVDCVYSLNVLEHIEDDGATLTALYARIRAGGRVIIYVPAFDVLFSEMDRLVGHHRRYRRKDLVAKMKGAGFEITDARYIDSLGFLAALAYRWVGNDKGVISPGAVRIYDRFLFPVSRVLDHLVFGSFGKNLLVVGTRPDSGAPPCA